MQILFSFTFSLFPCHSLPHPSAPYLLFSHPLHLNAQWLWPELSRRNTSIRYCNAHWLIHSHCIETTNSSIFQCVYVALPISSLFCSPNLHLLLSYIPYSPFPLPPHRVLPTHLLMPHLPPFLLPPPSTHPPTTSLDVHLIQNQYARLKTNRKVCRNGSSQGCGNSHQHHHHKCRHQLLHHTIIFVAASNIITFFLPNPDFSNANAIFISFSIVLPAIPLSFPPSLSSLHPFSTLPFWLFSSSFTITIQLIFIVLITTPSTLPPPLSLSLWSHHFTCSTQCVLFFTLHLPYHQVHKEEDGDDDDSSSSSNLELCLDETVKLNSPYTLHQRRSKRKKIEIKEEEEEKVMKMETKWKMECEELGGVYSKLFLEEHCVEKHSINNTLYSSASLTDHCLTPSPVPLDHHFFFLSSYLNFPSSPTPCQAPASLTILSSCYKILFFCGRFQSSFFIRLFNYSFYHLN